MDVYGIKEIRQNVVEEIAEFQNGGRGWHYKQSYEWGASVFENGFYCVTRTGRRIRACSLVRVGRVPRLGMERYWIDRGPVFEDSASLDEHLNGLQAYAAKKVVWIQCNPYLIGQEAKVVLNGKGFRILENADDYTTTVSLELDRSFESIRAGFRRSLKSQINRAARMGMISRDDNSHDRWSWFCETYNRVAKIRGLWRISCSVQDALYEAYLKRDGPARLYIAEFDGESAGGIFVVRGEKRAFFVLGVTKDNWRCRPITHALHEKAIKWARDGGCKYYDFGGYWMERGDRDPINRFKTGYSKNIELAGPCFRYYPSEVIEKVSNANRSLRKWLAGRDSGR